jgi:hypothetical protein
MPSEEKDSDKNEKIPGMCNAPKANGGYCHNKSLDYNEHCRIHAGTKYDGNIKHGMYADRQNYYETCSAKEQAWIDSVVSSFLEDAPFEADNFGKFQKLRNIAIDMHKVRNANDYIKEEGLRKESVVGYDDDNNPILNEEEHELNVAVDRLKKTNTRELKELGVLDDPDSKKAESGMSIAKELSKINDDT